MTMFLNIMTSIPPTFAFIFLVLIGINLFLLGWTLGFSNGLKRRQDSALETVQLGGGE